MTLYRINMHTHRKMKHVFGASENCVLISVGRVRQHVHLFSSSAIFMTQMDFIIPSHHFPLSLSFRQPRVKGESRRQKEMKRGGYRVKCQAKQISNVRPIRRGENKRRQSAKWTPHAQLSFAFFRLCSWLDGLSRHSPSANAFFPHNKIKRVEEIESGPATRVFCESIYQLPLSLSLILLLN